MFGRTVTIDGTEIFIMCTPDTPYSEILDRAANRLRREEKDARENSPIAKQYREALR